MNLSPKAYSLQQLVATGIVLILALLVGYLSYTQEPADAFLFPQLISIFFVGFAIWSFLRAVMGIAKVGSGVNSKTITNMLPGLALIIVVVYWLAKLFGFYTASTFGFFVLFSLYDSSSNMRPSTWLGRAGITIGFMAVIYGLFALLLKVQTPRGILF